MLLVIDHTPYDDVFVAKRISQPAHMQEASFRPSDGRAAATDSLNRSLTKLYETLPARTAARLAVSGKEAGFDVP